MLDITIGRLVPQYPLNIMYIVIFTDENPSVRSRSPAWSMAESDVKQAYLIPMVLVFFLSGSNLNQHLKCPLL